MVDPQNGWFIVKNTIKMDDLGVPLFQQTFIYIYNYLFGGWPTPLKNMSSSVGMILPNIWKNKNCSKPPTSYSNNNAIIIIIH